MLATIVGEGHDAVGANVVLSRPDGTTAAVAPMGLVAPGTDRRSAWVVPTTIGTWTFRVEAWGDPITTWQHRAAVKIPADLDVELELEEGARLYEQALKGLPRGRVRTPVKEAIGLLRDPVVPAAARLAAVSDPAVQAVLAAHPLRLRVTKLARVPRARRARARTGRFLVRALPPLGGRDARPAAAGTFATAAERLPAIADMGFDVVYLPPIHPIGTSFRKGPNNTLTPGPDDPGSPWAIGSVTAGTMPCTPTSEPSTTSATSSPRPTGWAWRSPSTSRCSAHSNT